MNVQSVTGDGAVVVGVTVVDVVELDVVIGVVLVVSGGSAGVHCGAHCESRISGAAANASGGIDPHLIA